MINESSPVIIYTEKNQNFNHVVIWLHGLGSDGHDFAPMIPTLKLEKFKFIFPHAPYRNITVNQGMKMRGWYDILTFELSNPAAIKNNKIPQDTAGVLETSVYIQNMIREEIKNGTPADRIFLAGFSQGGAVALFSGLTFEEKLAGILALSTYLPIQAEFEQKRQAIGLETPILICHGLQDNLLPVFMGQHAYEYLQQLNYQDINFKTYPMDHTVCLEELNDVRDWMQGRL